MLSISPVAANSKPVARPWSDFVTDGPVEPDEGAGELAVARFLDEMRYCTELPASSVVKYCQRHQRVRSDFNTGATLTYLRLMSSKERPRHLGTVHHSHWGWTVVTFTVPNWIAYCPRTRWLMNRRTGDVFFINPPCDNWRCERACAGEKAEKVIERARDVFLRDDRVWYAAIPFDDSQHAWLRKRRERRGGGALWVHRDWDKLLHVFASEDLSSTERPNLGEWLTPLDALSRLIHPTLALPGVSARRWLGTWAPEPAPKKKPSTFKLGSAPHEVMQAAVRKATAALEATHGIGALDRFCPDEVETIWLPIVKAEVDEQWRIYKAANAQAARS